MFLVVETVNDKGEKEWKVAPKRWVYNWKNSRRPILIWPSQISPEQQYQLAREKTSASAALEVLLANSSLSASMPFRKGVPRKIKIHMNKRPKDLLEPEDEEAEQLPAIVERNVQPYPENDASTLAAITKMVNSLMEKTESIETQNSRIEKQNAYIMERNSRIQKENCELMKELILIHRRFEYLVSQQIEITKGSVENSSFHFDPVETIEQLDELENRLNDETFFFEMVAWLKLNVVGLNPAKRMSSCLDLLFSLEMQANSLWTGTTRDGTGCKRRAIRERNNILAILKAIGITPWEKVNYKNIAWFMRNKLKSARQRLASHRKRIRCNKLVTTLDDSQQLFEYKAINNADSLNGEQQIYAESMEGESETLFEIEILH
ncbi:uncharacterized protein LOC125960231 isoform X10 [Anopheles darlingi]|uniref:uncharacterized protein LOC125960231 isoform X10 n=1 Tax=Anopheles darlingi TaxID=43151 RepID=UPI0020FFFD91|nr:uncharacterized protein LOC125960231 isoform X10 [Anopheles darlingi]